MAWQSDRIYAFTISRLLEGFLNIQTLTISAGGWSWDLIVGGVDQGITPGIHPGDIVSISMTVRNTGAIADNFIARTTVGASTPEESGIMNLAIGASGTWVPSTFVMPDADVDVLIETFHEEPEGILPVEGLISHWNFNEGLGTTIYDSAGNNDGVLINDPTWVSGKSGNALQFDGINNYVDCGNIAIPNEFTISLWIKPQLNQEYCFDGTKGNYGIAGCVNSAEETSTWSWQLRYGSADDCSLGMQLNTLAGSKWVTIGYNLTANVWSHIVVTFSGTDEKIYVNGILTDVNTFAFTIINTNVNNKILLGVAGWGESNTYYDGSIDDVMIYNREISQSEVNIIHDTQK